MAKNDGMLANPLLGHPIDPGQGVYLAGEVVFITRTMEAERVVVRFFLKSIYEPSEIVLPAGKEFDRV